MPLKRFLLAGLAGTLFFILGCGGGGGGTSAPPTPTILITPTTVSLTTNQTQQFAATINNGTGTVSWTATAGSISTDGLYTAPATPGNAVVTASMTGNSSVAATANVTISNPPTSVSSVVPANGATGVNVLLSRITIRLTQANANATAIVDFTPSNGPRYTSTVNNDVITINFYGALPFNTKCSIRVENIDTPFSSTFTTESIGTQVTNNLSGNVAWTIAGSPYYIPSGSTVYMLDGATLSIEPGVEVIGTLFGLTTNNFVTAIGTNSQHIRCASGSFIGINGSYMYCDFLGFNPATTMTSEHPAGEGNFDLCYIDLNNYLDPLIGIISTVNVGSKTMSNCTLYLNGESFVKITSGTIKQCYFDYLRFSNNDLGQGSSFTNNYIKGNGSSPSIMQINVDYLRANPTYTISKNTFDKFQPGTITAFNWTTSTPQTDYVLAGNYWGTTDTSVISASIRDHTTDVGNPLTVQWTPILSAPDPLTPSTPPATRM
jgi:hypothetical protein